MSSCLGIYVDKNLIKYAKLKRVRDSFKVELFNVEVFEDLEETLKRIVIETNSTKDPICINVSNEIYNYFDVFSELEKKDITKSLDIEFEMLCQEKGYDKESLESRYLLADNKENIEKYKALYISTTKSEIDEKVKILSNYKLSSITSVLTSITNLVECNENENVAVVNLENETKVTTVINGQITRVDILNSALEEVIEKINKVELSWKKSYDTFKNITIYNHEIQSLDEHENEYIEIVMPAIEKIAKELKKLFSSFKEKIDKVYITGMGATISNIDLYLQDFFGDAKCEILKPFFINSNSSKVPTKEYIEVNSAIALALDGLEFVNKDLNFAPVSLLENIMDFENIKKAKETFDIKNWKAMLEEPLDIQEKLIVRGMAVCLIAIMGFSCFGGIISKNNIKQKEKAEEMIEQTIDEIAGLDSQASQIETYINTYTTLIENAETEGESSNKNTRVIAKDAIPNLLNKIMFIIPQQVQIISIQNTENNHIVIEAVSEKYEQLGYFSAAIKAEEVLKNVQSTSGEKSDSLIQITIEGDLP